MINYKRSKSGLLLRLLGEFNKLSTGGLVAGLDQILQSLLASRSLAAADDTAMLVLHQILAGQSAGSVLGGSVVYLGASSNSGSLRSLACLSHFFYFRRSKKYLVLAALLSLAAFTFLSLLSFVCLAPAATYIIFCRNYNFSTNFVRIIINNSRI
jgi:hypothetical protein